MSDLSAFLLVVAVFLTLPSPTGQLLKCPSGQRIHTPSAGPDMCEDCDPGTFMNLSEHSEQVCYQCSTCPAGHVGRPCNTTSDTVCCPYPDMTVMDMEGGAYCAIPASQHKANHTTTDTNTHQVSECGGTQNTSGSAALGKPNKDIIALLGHIVAVMLALHSMFVLTPPQVPRCYKWSCIIFMAIIIPVILRLTENGAEDMVFLIFVSFSFIYCIVVKVYQTCFFYYIRKKTNVCKATEVPVSTRATSPEADEDLPESQSSDPLITGTSSNSCVVELSSQDDPSLSPGGSSNKHDSDDCDPGATADWRSNSRHELLSTTTVGELMAAQEYRSTDTGCVSSHQTSATAEELAKAWHGASECLLSSETTVGSKLGSSDVSVHTQAGVVLSGSYSCIGTEPNTLTSGAVNIQTAKEGCGHYTLETEDGNIRDEVIEVPCALALKVKSDSSQ